ncbi:hypothetical protein H1C71_040590 [Ictidomys tridecemlineatus]|nr:hypothetical protein H1C71_040590 [Ictidomys tridecemlineatus]
MNKPEECARLTLGTRSCKAQVSTGHREGQRTPEDQEGARPDATGPRTVEKCGTILARCESIPFPWPSSAFFTLCICFAIRGPHRHQTRVLPFRCIPSPRSDF